MDKVGAETSYSALDDHIDALLSPTGIGTPFIFKQPLGQAREVKGALSGLFGRFVTRAGPITDASASAVDQEALARLNLRPVFVGIDRDLVRAAIDGEADTIRGRLAAKVSPDDFARRDGAGGWIIPLGAERRIVGGA